MMMCCCDKRKGFVEETFLGFFKIFLIFGQVFLDKSPFILLENPPNSNHREDFFFSVGTVEGILESLKTNLKMTVGLNLDYHNVLESYGKDK